MRQVLPRRRAAETFDLSFWNQLVTVTVGFHADGTLGEIFISTGKTGTDIASAARDAAVVISLALQHGVRSGAAASILGAVIDCVSAKTFSGDVR